MKKIVNLRFRDACKVYKFSCNGLNLTIGDAVMVNVPVLLVYMFFPDRAGLVHMLRRQTEMLYSVLRPP